MSLERGGFKPKPEQLNISAEQQRVMDKGAPQNNWDAMPDQGEMDSSRFDLKVQSVPQEVLEEAGVIGYAPGYWTDGESEGYYDRRKDEAQPASETDEQA